jgi:hypothetical protein
MTSTRLCLFVGANTLVNCGSNTIDSHVLREMLDLLPRPLQSWESLLDVRTNSTQLIHP